MTETIAQPEPLLGLNGRTTFPAGHGDDADLNPRVIAAPGYQLFIAGKHNAVAQYVSIDPGQGYLQVLDALERGRALATGNRHDVDHPPSDRSIIAALRLALYEGYAKDTDALKVARAILDQAMPTGGGVLADSGVKLLVGMLRDGTLRAELAPVPA